jgi:hypothetical protein
VITREVEGEGKRGREEEMRNCNRRGDYDQIYYMHVQKCPDETPQYLQFNVCQLKSAQTPVSSHTLQSFS